MPHPQATPSDLFFEPWIGENYRPLNLGFFNRQPGAYPMHLLGESHYGQDWEYQPAFTQAVVSDLGHDPGHSVFFRNLLNAISLGDDRHSLDLDAAWSFLGFSNYIQDFLPGPRLPPTEAMWKRGHRAFPELLRRTTPEAILVCGKRLWLNMRCGSETPIEPISKDDVTLDDAILIEYESAGATRRALVCHILHPSAPKFDLRKARLRLWLFRQLIDNVDLGSR